MNVESPSATSSSAGAQANQRKERGAIAAQACETCRTRKQRCDEQRPKCGTCVKFKLDCRYREPQPTKKDKTLVEILDRLKIIEGKVDFLGDQQQAGHGEQPPEADQRPPNVTPGSSGDSVYTTSSNRQSGSSSPPSPLRPYLYVAAVHTMLSWPVVQRFVHTTHPVLPNLYAVILEQARPAILLEQQTEGRQKLPTEGMEALSVDDRVLIGLRMDANSGPGGWRVSDLDWATTQNLSKAYFDTFNLIHPILDRQSFNNELLLSAFNKGSDEGTTSTIVCLVFALGTLALADSQSVPPGIKGRHSGVKGGTSDRPPGLAFFNEARKRLGFTMSQCTLETVQIHALAGLYFESCSRHLDFWRMTMSASMACHALITSNPGELDSPRGDLIRRVFWHCAITETCLNLELDLSSTGLDKLEDVVGIPVFSEPYCEADYLANQESCFQEHFYSQIYLRKFSVDFNNTLRSSIGPTAGLTPFPPPQQQLSQQSVISTVNHMASQLDEWRDSLPDVLRWSDEDATALPSTVPGVFNSVIFNPQLQRQMFSTDLTHPSTHYAYAADVQVALLRTRYYYTKYLLYRPCLYKALHHANTVDTDDAKGVVECLKACLKWPIVLSPTCYRKRLIPCLFFWTQNILGVLIILHLSEQVPVLTNIRSQLCEQGFNIEVTETVNLYINWIRDLRSHDPTADWCWNILRGLYHLEE